MFTCNSYFDHFASSILGARFRDLFPSVSRCLEQLAPGYLDYVLSIGGSNKRRFCRKFLGGFINEVSSTTNDALTKIIHCLLLHSIISLSSSQLL